MNVIDEIQNFRLGYFFLWTGTEEVLRPREVVLDRTQFVLEKTPRSVACPESLKFYSKSLEERICDPKICITYLRGQRNTGIYYVL